MVAPRRALALAAMSGSLVVVAAAAASAPPPVRAPAFVSVADVDGRVLAARRATDPRAMASITKLMTVLVALEHARPDEVVTVPAAATRIGESTVQLRPGERLTVRDLAIAALLPSANDAAAALALHVGKGSQPRFVALMNRKAAALGMRGTRYVNPHGLDAPGHRSTALDSVLLLEAALENPFVRTWAGREAATLAGGRRVESSNDLLRSFPPLVAGKTGQTDDAGWSQVAAAERDGVRVRAAVLGAASRDVRNDDLERLLRWSLAQYRRSVVVDGRRTYARAEVGWGLAPVALVAARPAVRTVSVQRPLVEQVVATQVAALPVHRGQRLGEVRVYDGERLVAYSALVAARDVPEPGLLAKARFTTGRALHHLAGFVS